MVNSTGRVGGPTRRGGRDSGRRGWRATSVLNQDTRVRRMALENRIRVQLRWRDLDQLGHVNQSVYHEFLEQGRGAVMMSVIELAGGGFEFVVARVELDYRHEIRFEDREV